VGSPFSYLCLPTQFKIKTNTFIKILFVTFIIIFLQSISNYLTMNSEESFEVTFKSRPSSPHDLESDRVTTPISNNHSPTMASDSTQPGNESQFDTLLSLVQNVNQQLMGMRQEYHELRDHVDNLHKKIENPVLDRGDNHHNPCTPISTPNYQTNRNVSNGPFNDLYGAGEGPQVIRTHDQPARFFHPFKGNENCFPPPAQSMHKSQMPVKLKDFDGTEDFNDFLAHFEILVTLHGWDYMTKSLYLASSLSGNARSILTELNEVQRTDYKSLVDLLNRRFGSLGRAELFRAQLKNRIKGNNESISELAQSIKKLTRLAYPTTDQSMLNILSVDQFIDALPDPGLRLRLREANPRDINEAEILAIRLETHRMADAQRSSSLQLINPYENNFKSLRDELHAIKTIVLNNQNPKPYHQPQPQMHQQSPNPSFSYSESHRVETPDYKFRPKPKQNKPKHNNQNMNWNHSRNPNTPMSDHFRPHGQGNYPMSSSRVGSRQTNGADPNHSQ
jgi:hypothetical protein